MKRIFFSKDVFFTTQNGGLSWKHEAPYLFVVSYSEMALLASCLSNTPYWNSAWDGQFTEEEQQTKIDLLDDLQAKLRGEKVELITTALNEINTTLQEMRDKMGSGNGDGEGNTIQDLIFWLKLLFAVTGAGLQGQVTTTPILSLINSTIASADLNAIMATINQSTLETKNNSELELIADKLQALVDKECPAPVQSVRLPKEVVDSGYNLLKNGGWQDGGNNGISGAFYPDYWLVSGNPALEQYPGRGLYGGVYHLTINGEHACSVRQSAIIPPGYTMPKFIMTWAGTFEDDKGKINIYVNNEEVTPVIVEETNNYLEMDFNASPGDTVKIELTYLDGSINHFGVAELFVYADELVITQEVTLPTIGGSMGKGRNRNIKPDKRMWETTYNHPNTALNWLVDKLETTADWFGLRLTASKTVVQSLTAVRVFRVDTTTKLCNVYFNTSMDDNGSEIVLDVFNDGVWENVKTCTISSSYAVKVNFGEITGDKLFRLTLNPTTTAGGNDFWFYDMEVEEID